MFENLQERLGSILNGLTGRGALSEQDVSAALREVRRALIEADVALEVVRSFTDKVREKAVGAEVLKSIKPGQMVVKIVHDELVEMLGSEGETIDLNAPAPVVMMMVGLQGSGKTTTTGKIAKRLTDRQGKKVLMASLDTRRPAAQEQLKQIGEQVSIATLPIIAGQGPVDIARRAVQAAKLGGHDVVILDTAGRTHIDEPLMVEMAEIKAAANPHETLLVADLMIGFKVFRERFTSHVTLERPHHIHVRYLEGPFRYLNNHWRFVPENDGTQVDFYVDFEFRSKILQAAIGLVFNEAVKLMVHAFERRARRIYGPPDTQPSARPLPSPGG